MTRTAAAATAFGLLVFLPAGAAQQTGASRTALAIVSDARNRSIVDVGADDFVIQEGGQAREVLDVRVADYPVVVMLDNGMDAGMDLMPQRQAVDRFLRRLGPRSVAIGTLAAPPRMITSFDDERQAAMERLEQVEIDRSAKSALLKGTSVGADAIRSTGALFGALVVLSSTTTDDSRGATDEMIAPIIDSRAVLHVIANRGALIQGGTGQIRSGGVLRSIADQTRGAFTVIYSPSSYQAALDRVAERLTSEMMIEYLVPPGSKPIDVKVGVRVTGARVRGLGVAPR
jgi:hypothetical protein